MLEENVLELDKKIEVLKAKRKSILKFADKLPIFREEIIKQELTGSESHIHFGDRYKSIYLNWGIYRLFYQSVLDMSNYRGDDSSGYFFRMYINSFSLYDLCDNLDLELYLKDVNIFFFDKSNTTIYVDDDNIEDLLEALNKWYLQAKDRAKIIKIKNKILQYEKSIAELKDQLKLLEEK